MENDRFTLNAFQPDRIALEANSNATGPNEHGNSPVVRSEGLIGRLGLWAVLTLTATVASDRSQKGSFDSKCLDNAVGYFLFKFREEAWRPDRTTS